MSTTKTVSKDWQSTKPASRQERLMQLGALAVSAGLTATQLKRLGEARRLRTLAAEMREESAAITAWVANGANPEDAPPTSKVLDVWQTEFTESDLAKA